MRLADSVRLGRTISPILHIHRPGTCLEAGREDDHWKERWKTAVREGELSGDDVNTREGRVGSSYSFAMVMMW
jgi:hypothetical protein